MEGLGCGFYENVGGRSFPCEPELELFEAAVKDGDDKHGEYFDGHSSEGGYSHGDHDVGASAGGCEHGDEGENSCGGGHEARADSSVAGLYDRGTDFGDRLGFSFCE